MALEVVEHEGNAEAVGTVAAAVVFAITVLAAREGCCAKVVWPVTAVNGIAIAVFDAAVINPLPLTVIVGTDDAEPHAPVFVFTVAKHIERDPAVLVTSPVCAGSWAACKVPATPVVRESPVPFVRLIADGVPRLGVTSVGEVAKTSDPDPVSSVTLESRLAELGVARNVEIPVPSPETPVVIGRPVEFASVAA